jgi:drug/metabolite transporter (DMT)-like permease
MDTAATLTEDLSHYQLKATLLVALSGILYGFMGYLGTKLLQEHLTVSSMLFWRFMVAGIWIVLMFPFIKKTTYHPVEGRAKLIKMILFGSLAYSGTSGFYFISSHYLGTGLAMVIFFSYPVFVVLFSWFLTNWKMNRYALGSLFAIILGVILLKGHGAHALNLTGLFFGFLSSLTYGLYMYGGRHNSKKMDTSWLTFLICLGNSAVFFVLCLATKTFSVPSTFHAWIYVIALGIFATALPIQLLLMGLKHINPVKASILSVLEPVVTLLIGFLFLAETMSTSQFVGVLIVLIGALLIQFENQMI